MLVTILALPALDGLAGMPVAMAVPPPAPALLGPASGTSVTIPFTISWSQVLDAGGYNWEISRSSDFGSVIERNAALLSGAATTQDVVSGLANGPYFWRSQAVSRDLEPGAWSSPRSFTVTGAGSGVPGSAVLDPPRNGTRFHSWETITFTWSAVPGAVSYILQESTDPAFPVDTRVRQVDIPGPTEAISFNPSIQGNFKARVIAVDASGLMGTPSNLVDFSVLDSNPFPSPPTLVAPTNGATLQLPLTLAWTHVPNHQELGYQVQIAASSSFTTIESSYRVTENQQIVPSLTTGTKFWRVRSQYGYIGADEAYTAWSATGTFTVAATPLRMGAVTFPATKFSGGEARGSIDLTGPAPAGGATVALTTTHPDLLPELPASRQIAAGTSSSQVLVAPTGATNSLRGMRVGYVTTPTTVTVTATYNGTSVSTTITLLPPRLNDTPLQLFPVKATGGTELFGIVDLEVGCFAGFCDGLAPPGGFPVSLSSSSPAATVPATVTIPAAAGGTQFSIQTSPVSTVTIVTITARAGDAIANWRITLTPPPAPSSLTLDPVETDNGSRGIVRIPLSSMVGHDQQLRLTSSNPLVASVPAFVTIPASSESGVFSIVTSAVTARTVVTISVTGGGVTRSADLIVHPSLPGLTGFTVNPTTVPGGTSATGTVTLGSAAPAGGVAVSLSSSLPGAVSVPATVTVPAGATSGTFTATTFPVDNTTAQLTATLGDTTLFAALGVTRAASITPTALRVTPTVVVGGASVTGTVTLSAPAATGGAVVTLSDNSAAATVPASVTVAAGATSRTFTVTTSAVSSPTAVSISASYGGGSASATLTVNPLAAPALQSPGDAATGVAQPVTFNWTDVANAVDYEIQVDSTSTISAPFVANQIVNVSQVSIGGLPAQQLWWRVRARNASGVFGPFSSTRRFTPVGASTTPSLGAPALVGPAVDARFNAGQTIVFDWSDVAAAASYTIQIDDQDTFSSPTVNQSVAASTYSRSTLPAARMWWRVRAVDASGAPGAWSSLRRFEVR
ncbi:MAG: hypothetical protein JWN29_1872 [Acidimicrobiales bacterium]|nr:hypothetical protein [Acidimicrobiales bacterium]